MKFPDKVVTGIGVSTLITPDHWANPFNIGFGCIVSAGATVSYKVEHTFDDVQAVGFSPATANWFTHPMGAGKTGNEDGTYAFPVRGYRLNVASSDGTVTLQSIQAGVGR